MLWAQLANRWNLENTATDEQKAFIIANWPGYDAKADGSFSAPYSRVRITWDEYRTWVEAGIELEIEACKSMMLVKIKDVAADPEEDPHTQFLNGRMFNVTLPDVGLLLIDEVSYETDCCTDHLQRQLDRGWRILAVCPPNAQRRPDYILGRSKAKHA